MRTFLLASLLATLSCGRPGHPVAVQLRVLDEELTPAERDLVETWLKAMNQELTVQGEAWRAIQERTDRMIRQALPPGKHRAYRRMMGMC